MYLIRKSIKAVGDQEERALARQLSTDVDYSSIDEYSTSEDEDEDPDDLKELNGLVGVKDSNSIVTDGCALPYLTDLGVKVNHYKIHTCKYLSVFVFLLGGN
jgi:hypothetical protein